MISPPPPPLLGRNNRVTVKVKQTGEVEDLSFLVTIESHTLFEIAYYNQKKEAINNYSIYLLKFTRITVLN